jgi:hypothetical protein
MTAPRHLFLLITAVIAGAALLAGCSSSDASEGVATLSGGTASSSPSPEPSADDSAEEAALKFAQCMRDNGVPDFPDPQVDADGNMRFQVHQGADIDPEAARKARDACQKYAPALRGGFSEEDRTRIQDSLLAYAKCMRENGYDMPDPDFSGGDKPFAIDIDRDDPAFQKAHAACEDNLAQLQMGPGGRGKS